jgi:DNA polymerase III epsilon subunit-like protein
MIVVDIETSGLSPKNNSILSIGAVHFDNPSNRFYEECLVRKDSKISAQALEVNGFEKDEITMGDKQSEESLVRNLVVWVKTIKDKVFAAHVPNFDFEFLKYCFEIYEIDNPFIFRPVDMHSIAYMAMVKRGIDPYKDREYKKMSGNVIFEFVGMPNEPLPHHGLTGALFETEVFSRILYGKNLIEDFKDCPVPDFLI